MNRVLRFKPFSKKQLQVLTWWHNYSPWHGSEAIICDGAIRSGKTLCMSISFVFWSFYYFEGERFALCGKTLGSLKRNILPGLLPILKELRFTYSEKHSQNLIEISYGGRKNTFYMFGGKDEGSASLIQGMTLAGVLFDEVALMPRSFVEQAIARCSVENSKLWFNCNPEYPGHWFRQEWILKQEQKRAVYIHFKMEDNPSLSKEMLTRYKTMYSGAFYKRFVEGEWTGALGTVYPFMQGDIFCDVPKGEFSMYAVSCDYGTVNPASFGLWGKLSGTWYRIDEYYYDSRIEGAQRTDEEHYKALCSLAGGRKITAVAADPSAASFIETIRRHGEYMVIPAKNNVLDGIRRVSTALKSGEIKICKSCADSIREFSLYRWESGAADCPKKENDHAMDDIRYFVTTLMDGGGEDFFAIAARRK